MDGMTPPQFTPYAAVEVSQEEDEFQSCCLPDFVLVKALEEVEKELGLSSVVVCAPASRFALARSQQQRHDEAPCLTQLVDDDNCATASSEEDAAERKRLSSHMLQMRANLETYLRIKLTGRQAKNLFEKIKQFECLPSHPNQIAVRELINAMHTIREYGNMAAHNQESLPGRKECFAAVARYSELKAAYEEHSTSSRNR